jgi:hypothetical protein
MSSQLVGGMVLGFLAAVALLVAYGTGVQDGQSQCAHFPKDSACVAKRR